MPFRSVGWTTEDTVRQVALALDDTLSADLEVARLRLEQLPESAESSVVWAALQAVRGKLDHCERTVFGATLKLRGLFDSNANPAFPATQASGELEPFDRRVRA